MNDRAAVANGYSLASLGLGLLFLNPHGGVYRPPPPPGPPIPVYDLPPPITGDSKPKGRSTSTPQSPGTPGQASSPTTPTRRQAPKGRQGGITIGIDGSSWTYWWEYNKSAFLQPRLLEADRQQSVITEDALLGRGARKEKRAVVAISKEDAKRIAIALRSQLRSESSDQQMLGSCLLSLAKTGHASVLDLAPHLANAVPMVRESAILAMGISCVGQEELFALLRADPEGTRLCGGRRPGYRERSFAAYSLGLLAKKKGDPVTSLSVLEAMIDRAKDRRERIDVRVAALQVMRMLDLPKAASKEREEQLAMLKSLALDGRSTKQLLIIQTQAMTALRGPLAAQGLARERLERTMAARLLAGKVPTPLRQSISQTLGFLSEEGDEDVVRALMKTAVRDKDELTRRFAFMALGRIGGEQAQDFLLEGLSKERSRNAEYAWLAIALALSCHERQDDGTLLLVKARPDIAKAIFHRFRTLNSRMPAAGVAVALGLIEHEEAADAIQKRLQRWKKHDEPAAYLALSLGLMGHRDAREQITTLMDQSRQREVIVVQSALALSLLGDRSAEAKLLTQLEKRQSTPVLSALAMGIGRLGTSASIDILIERLDRHEGSRSSRAFMAVALGELLIQKQLRWNATLSWGIQYRYAPASLTGNSGVLDLL